MTSRRVQSGTLIKERKKYQARFGKVVSEVSVKKWNCLFFPNDNKLEERKSAQLSVVVNSSDVPPEVLHWFKTGQLQDTAVPTSLSKSPSPSSINNHEKENPSRRRVTPKHHKNRLLSPLSTPRPPTLGDVNESDSDVDVDEQDDATKSSDILGTARRKSCYGRSVRKKQQDSQPNRVGRRVVLFDDDDSDSGSEQNPTYSKDPNAEDDANGADDTESDDIIMTAERLLTLDEELEECHMGAQALATDNLDPETKRKTMEYYKKLERARAEKKELIGKTITVINGTKTQVFSEWRIIKDIVDIDSITAKKRPQEEIGVVDMDFNRLPEAEYPLVEVLLRFWPGDAFKQLDKLNVAFQKQYPGKDLVTMKEFFTFFACLLAAAPAGYGGDKLWKPPIVKGIFPHPDLSKVMRRARFKAIKTCYAAAFACDHNHVVKEGECWADDPVLTPGNDEWSKLQGLVNDFNSTVRRNFSASSDKCIDESMSPFRPRQSKTANLPHISYILRKPKPLGTEYKTTGCAESGIMLKLEIQRGKVRLLTLNQSIHIIFIISINAFRRCTILLQTPMRHMRHCDKYGGTAACTLRLGENVVSSDRSHCDTMYGDSWFASVRTALAVQKELNCHFIGHVKIAHKRFPKDWMEKTMEHWPGGTHLVLESCFDDTNLIALGYKYNANKVCHFIMTRGASLTTPGDPYLAKFKSSKGNYKSREVRRPLAVSSYFGSCGKIDVHNQIRQSQIALEEFWVTKCGWFRNVCTILGISATNAFFACSYSFARDCEYSQLKAKDFASILSNQLIAYPFPNTASFGRNVLPPGQDPPQWFELIPGRYVLNSIQPCATVLLDVTNSNDETITVGRAQFKSGWSQMSPVAVVGRPDGAPVISPDITDYHRQVKIRTAAGNDGKRHRPPQCKICKSYGLKQKKSPYLCVECGDFFCHDSETGRNGSCPRQCFWTHMCTKFKDSGFATPHWARDFEVWNNERISRCKVSDGIIE